MNVLVPTLNIGHQPHCISTMQHNIGARRERKKTYIYTRAANWAFGSTFLPLPPTTHNPISFPYSLYRQRQFIYGFHYATKCTLRSSLLILYFLFSLFFYCCVFSSSPSFVRLFSLLFFFSYSPFTHMAVFPFCYCCCVGHSGCHLIALRSPSKQQLFMNHDVHHNNIHI